MIRSLLQTLASARVLILLCAAQAVVGTVLAVTLWQLHSQTGQGIPDFMFGYTIHDLDSLFGAYGEHGMALYMRVHFIDLLNPSIYSLLTLGIASRVLATFERQRFALLVLVPGALDYLENALLFRLAVDFPPLNEDLVAAGSAVSVVKHISLGMTVFVLIALGTSARRSRQDS